MKYVKIIIKKIIQIFIKPIIYIIYNANNNKNVHKVINRKNNSFFGYYNKCPWNKSQTKILSLQVIDAAKEPDNTSEASLVIIDLVTKKEQVIATTHCWNTQQGCMMQWMGPDFENNIIFNDYEDGKYVSKIYNLEQNRIIKVIDMPIYDVSSDGLFALSLDFSRLHIARPGYGYKNKICTNKNELCPNDYCIWKIDLNNGIIKGIVKYTDLLNFETRDDMEKSFHKVNHIVINPSNTRFMFLHRWISGTKKYTRLLTCNIDGSDMYNLSDDNMVSHCCWKNNNEILGFLRKKKEGNHYYLLKDKTQIYSLIWKGIKEDGHCTYNNSKGLIVSDTYPNIFGISKVLVGKENDVKPHVLATFFSPNNYNNDLRCDLHPRWSYDDTKICVDSVNDGFKKIYIIDYNKEE